MFRKDGFNKIHNEWVEKRKLEIEDEIGEEKEINLKDYLAITIAAFQILFPFVFIGIIIYGTLIVLLCR